MARTFDLASGPNYTIQSVGTLAGISNGAFTLMCLVNVTSGNNSCGLLSWHDSGGVTLTEFLIDGNQLFVATDASNSGTGNDFNGGNTGVTVGNWWWCVVRFPGGTTQHPRYSLKALGGSIAHVNSTSNLNQAAKTATTIRLGDSDDRGNGSIAVWAAWLSDLSDADVDTATSLAAADIAALSPDALWLGNQSSATDLIDDETGNGADGASINGTVGVGTDPPSYDYTLGGGGGTDHAGAVASSVTATLAPAATHVRFGAIAASSVASLAPTPHQIHGAAISSAVAVGLTPAAVHIRGAAIAATAAATLAPAVTQDHTAATTATVTATLAAAATPVHPAAITADAVPALFLSPSGHNQGAIAADVAAALAAAETHTRTAVVALHAVAGLITAASSVGAHAISSTVIARMAATILAAIIRDITVTYGQPELAWAFGPPELAWHLGTVET